MRGSGSRLGASLTIGTRSLHWRADQTNSVEQQPLLTWACAGGSPVLMLYGVTCAAAIHSRLIPTESYRARTQVQCTFVLGRWNG